MATASAFFKAAALLFSTFPDRAPTGDHKDLVLKTWMQAFKDLTDVELLEAASRVIMSRQTLFPGDNLIAIVREAARPGPTQGDALELLSEAVSKFGRYRDDEAVAWIETISPVAAAAVRRFGFLNWCDSTNQETARGQFRAVFKDELERFQRDGKVTPTAIAGPGQPGRLPGAGSLPMIENKKEPRGGNPTRVGVITPALGISDATLPHKPHIGDPLFSPADEEDDDSGQ